MSLKSTPSWPLPSHLPTLARYNSPSLFHPPPLHQTPGNVVGRLVFNYCTHHGLWDTASLVARDVLAGAVAVSEAQRAEQAGLRRLAAHVRAGDVDAALEESEALGPGVLAARPGIRFRLLAQKLAELVRSGCECVCGLDVGGGIFARGKEDVSARQRVGRGPGL